MRQNATTEAQAAASLAALDRAAWIDPLPPVQVVCADDDNPAVDLVLPEGTTETIRWRLNLEGGGQREGHIAFGQLECSAAIKLDARKLERRRLPLPGDLPWGYHSLTVEPGGGATTIIVTPGRCWLPETLREGRRLWGIAAQLYVLRSDNNWGIGDFTDLRQLVDMAASRGAGVIGLNPLHALFFDDPDHVSPYSPASRLMLNVLNIDVTAIPELAACAEMLSLIASDAFRSRLEAARAARLVDYAAVAKLKLPVLEKLFDACRTAADRRWREFEKFRRERGEVFARHCLFIALREHFANKDPALADWHAWPADFHRPGSSAVARFRAENQSRLDFLTWLQWIADEQLAAAASAASEQGMAVGLYRDLAIGADRSGAE
jgi:4-alpha-glucanotransferase